ncbi:MAG: STAS domain-containing protein [Planctomycetota bacterium]
MKLSSEDYGEVSVVVLSGEFTAEDTDTFNRSLTDCVSRGAKHAILDLEAVEFVDSAALESMLSLQERLGERGGQLRLVRPDSTVVTILSLTRLDLALESHESVESAVRSLR